jgi:hypothetical protein
VYRLHANIYLARMLYPGFKFPGFPVDQQR